MRHGYFGRNLSRSSDEKKQLLVSLTRDLVLHDRIVTTKAKAKAVQPMVEKLVTKAKKGTQDSYRRILAETQHADVTKKLVADAKERFVARGSGYTRIVKLGRRQGDRSEMVELSFVDEVKKTEVVSATKPVSGKTPVKEVKESKKTAEAKKPVTRRRTAKKEA